MYANMSATGINTATTTPAATAAAVVDEVSTNNSTNYAKIVYGVIENNGDENSSFYTLPSLKELQLPSSCKDLEHKVPLENSGEIIKHLSESEVENSQASIRNVSEFSKDHVKQVDVENSTAAQASLGLNLLQQSAAASSPPPHSYRHSRAYRHFKNPPQPHMCIRTTTEAGEELFINVLSWTRIVIPQEPTDPIPLYGGMRVPPGSLRSPPVVFAVMANPEVLKDSGRHSKDPEERRAMVELMCDFVEAMNPGVKLVRNAVILKDRDISGELKDVWNAVQAQRDREREEQMILQRQQHQQHFHNITNGTQISSLNSDNITTTTQQMFSKSMQSGFSEDATLMTVDGGTPPGSRKIIHEVQNDNMASNIDIERDKEMTRTNNSQVSLELLAEHLDNNLSIIGDKHTEECSMKQETNQYTLANNALSNVNNSKHFSELEKISNTEINNEIIGIKSNDNIKKQNATVTNGSIVNCNDTEVSNLSRTVAAVSISNAVTSIPAENPPTNITSHPAIQQAPTKKEKLVGFLPNGCIFPRFTKNNKHKDKDKDKEKEPKTKDKEKNVLLSALKKSKDKKSSANTTSIATAAATASNTDDRITSSNSNTTATNCNQTNSKQQKNCLQQLECGVQKLDLNNHPNHSHIVENNINNSAATNKSSTNTTTNTGGVSVH